MPSPQRRPVAAPKPVAPPPLLPPVPRPPHVRSPERSRLAAAIDRLAGLGERREALEAAMARAEMARADARRDRDEAERELRDAERTEPAELISEFLSGAADRSGTQAAEIRDRIAAAEREHERAGKVIDACRAELAGVDRAMAMAKSDVRNALRDVVASDAATKRLIEAHAQAQGLVRTLSMILEFVPGLPDDTGPPEDGWPINGGAIQQWRQALANLERDPDFPLPSDEPARDPATA